MKRMAGAAAVLVAGMFTAAAPAGAETIDLSTWTCRKFQAASKDEVGIVLAWLDGYYRNDNDPPVIDTDQFAVSGKKLSQYCAAHPEAGLITAADDLFAK